MDKECVNEAICKNCKCKIRCCERYGCSFSPFDFEKITFENLKKELDKGYIAIDFIGMEDSDLEDNTYYLRMRHLGMGICDTDSQGGKCCQLTKNGCNFSYKERPTGGKTLIPKEDGNCICQYSIKKIAKEWFPYREILRQLLLYYKQQEN